MTSRGSVAAFLTDATGDEAQLALSFLVWPEECPDPRVVDEWLQREEAGPATAASLAREVEMEQATRPGKFTTARLHRKPVGREGGRVAA